MKAHRFPWGIKQDADIAIVDCRSKSMPLIAEACREVGMCARIYTVEEFCKEALRASNLRIVILSGGPDSIYQHNALRIPKEIVEQLLTRGVKFLGICYGAQLLADLFGGAVKRAAQTESGPTELTITSDFAEYFGGQVVMNHGDEVSILPPGWKNFGSTESCHHALFGREDRAIICTQWHPEMGDAMNGDKFLKNILFDTAGCRQDYFFNPLLFVEKACAFIKEAAGNDDLLVGLSGGVDSSVAYELAVRALSAPRVVAVVVNNGFLVEGEFEALQERFRDRQNMLFVDAAEEFYQAVEAVPFSWDDRHYYDKLRKVIGWKFIRVFEKEARKLGRKFKLVMGTNYSDIISSQTKLVDHHNVGGLPEEIGFDTVEPLAGLYKTEIRLIAIPLRFTKEEVYRQPSPGPGSAIRAYGPMTRGVANVVNKANRILGEIIIKYYPDPRERPQQYYVCFMPLWRRGLFGDMRIDGFQLGVRLVTSGRETYATVNPFFPTPEVAREIYWRLAHEVQMADGTRIVGIWIDISPKPLATTEQH